MRNILVLICLFFFHFQLNCQSKKNEKYYVFPHWIYMVDSCKTNYYEALKAFDLYFSKHKLPYFDSKKVLNIVELDSLNRVYKLKYNSKDALIFQIRRFYRWKKDIFNFVQDDGSILTIDEQIKLWNKSKK